MRNCRPRWLDGWSSAATPQQCIGDPAAPPIVWLRIGNCTNRVLFAWLEPLLPDIVQRLNAGNRVVEVRR